VEGEHVPIGKVQLRQENNAFRAFLRKFRLLQYSMWKGLVGPAALLALLLAGAGVLKGSVWHTHAALNVQLRSSTAAADSWVRPVLCHPLLLGLHSKWLSYGKPSYCITQACKWIEQ